VREQGSRRSSASVSAAAVHRSTPPARLDSRERGDEVRTREPELRRNGVPATSNDACSVLPQAERAAHRDAPERARRPAELALDERAIVHRP